MENNPISRLESETIKAALKGLLLNLIAAFGNATAKIIDPTIAEQDAALWANIIVNGISCYYYARAYIGRMKATTAIEPLPWKQEIKNAVTGTDDKTNR